MHFWLNALIYLAFALFAYLSVRFCLPYVLAMLERAGLVRPNYRGDQIPVAAGLVVAVVPVVWLALGAAVRIYHAGQALALIMLLVSFGFVGIIDDALGSREKTGLKGHLSALLKGELTTGGFKALFGGFTALSFAVFAGLLGGRLTWGGVILDSLVVALSANALNLFDLRPGRAGKAFFAGAAVLCGVAWPPGRAVIILPVAGALAGFLPADLSARAMLGDTGSNPLGASLGAFAVFALTARARFVYLLALIALHAVAEFSSMSAIIERSRLLRSIDQWGRH